MLNRPSIENGEYLAEHLATRSPRLLLLDIGGVLFPDPWETIVGDERIGLAKQLDAPQLFRVARELWDTFSLRNASEEAYWETLGATARVKIPIAIVNDITQRLLNPYEWSMGVLNALPSSRIAIVSDNTEFWYQRQKQLLRIESHSMHQYLSFRCGLSKKSKPGLLEMAIEESGVEDVLFVDDRQSNLDRASQLGIETLLFHSPISSTKGDEG